MVPPRAFHPSESPTVSGVLELLQLEPGMVVAAMGAGASPLAALLSDAAGPSGHVFAIESAPAIVESLRTASQQRHNLHLVDAPRHATPLASDSCDRVIVANLWNGAADPIETVREAARLLREDGRLLVIEWRGYDDGAPSAGLKQAVHFLENHAWDIHRHREVGACNYFLEAAVTDESVQS